MLDFHGLVHVGVITPCEGTGQAGCYVTEASDLRMPPGKFPNFLKVKAFGRTISLKAIRGDEHSVTYDSCGDGMINLKIFND